jgi:hypothetical protein
MIKNEDLQKEVAALRRRYMAELETLMERAQASAVKIGGTGLFSSHDAFNMAATCTELTSLAGKIEQTENCLRWNS